jgi:exonuclease III
MKVLTWNCNLVFRKDFELIRHFDSDIIVIQECEKLDLDQFDGYKSHWIGMNDSKGLAVLTKGESTFPSDLFRSDLVYFLPISFGDTAVLGVWAFNGRAGDKIPNSSGYVLDALSHYDEWINSHKNIVIAGDFNNAPRFDKSGHINNFADINTRISDLGLKSAYHDFFNETFGEESKFTHFHQKNPDRGFHIDYIFSNFEKSELVKVGDLEEWISVSDHLPIYCKFSSGS